MNAPEDPINTPDVPDAPASDAGAMCEQDQSALVAPPADLLQERGCCVGAMCGGSLTGHVQTSGDAPSPCQAGTSACTGVYCLACADRLHYPKLADVSVEGEFICQRCRKRILTREGVRIVQVPPDVARTRVPLCFCMSCSASLMWFTYPALPEQARAECSGCGAPAPDSNAPWSYVLVDAPPNLVFLCDDCGKRAGLTECLTIGITGERACDQCGRIVDAGREQWWYVWRHSLPPFTPPVDGQADTEPAPSFENTPESVEQQQALGNRLEHSDGVAIDTLTPEAQARLQLLVRGGTTTSAFDKEIQEKLADTEHRRAEDAADRKIGTIPIERGGGLVFEHKLADPMTGPRVYLQYVGQGREVLSEQLCELVEDDTSGDRLLIFVCPECVRRGIPMTFAQCHARAKHRAWHVDRREAGRVKAVKNSDAPNGIEYYTSAGVIMDTDVLRCDQTNCGCSFKIHRNVMYRV